MRIILSLLLIFVWGCNTPDKNGIGICQGDVVAPFSVENESKQIVSTIEYQELKSWLEKNRDIRIWTICAVDRSGYGKTNAFVIVYEKAISDNCSSCGQKVPVEKNP